MMPAAVAMLELRDTDFIKSVVAGLPDLAVSFLRAGSLVHPSPPPARLIVDRMSFCDPFLRQLMMYWSRSGTYVMNNPFFTLVFDKLSELVLYDRLSIRHPRTAVLPRANLGEDLTGIVDPPDWKAVEEHVGFPCIVKPVDGYAWQDVSRAESAEELHGIYDALRTSRTLLVQELVSHTAYYRVFCVGRRDVRVVAWKPLPEDRGVYSEPEPGELGVMADLISRKSLELNGALGLDFNSVEWCIDRNGRPVVIDSLNDVPDVRKEKLPPDCYNWVVDRFCECIRQKLADGDRNTVPAGVPGNSDSGTGPG